MPRVRYEEFLRRYAASGLVDGPEYEPKYLVEIPDRDVFRMYFDVDFVSTVLSTPPNLCKLRNCHAVTNLLSRKSSA